MTLFQKLSLLLSCFLSLQLYAAEGYLLDKECVKKKLAEMVAVDQSLRSQINVLNIDESLICKIRKNDQENTETLREILKHYYWITISEFGEEADRNAWLLVQHADHDREFQKEILVRLEQLIRSYGTRRQNYALLYDRVAIHEHRPQRYGTQGEIKNGIWVPFEIEDPNNLDERRKKLGLSPMQEYINKIHQMLNLK